MREFLQDYNSKPTSMSALTAKVELWLPITDERAAGRQHGLSTSFSSVARPQKFVLVRIHHHGASGNSPPL